MACLFGHKWNGCKCERCGKTRDEQHDPDECTGKCKRCGKVMQESQHNWSGCTCSRCGATRNEQHIWDNRKCSQCGIVIDVNAHDINGNTELLTEVKRKRIDAIKQLVEYGANVNHQNNDGNTPLIIACDEGLFINQDHPIQDTRLIIDILIEAGADINIKNHRGKTAMDVLDVGYGAYENKLAMKEMLLADMAKRKQLLETGKIEFEKSKAHAIEKMERKKRIEDMLPRCSFCGGIMDVGDGIDRTRNTVERWARCRKCDKSVKISGRPIQDGDIT